jgi:uncharacterized protein (TIGR02266 family)
MSRTALLTRLDRGLTSRVRAALVDARVEATQVPWGPDTLGLVRRRRFDIVIIGYPVIASTLSSFVRGLRAADSASRTTGLVLTAHAEDAAPAEGFVGRGVNRVIRYTRIDEDLASTVRELLEVAPRTVAQLATTITVPHVDGGRPLRYHTENISASGMLLRGPASPEVGTTVEVEIRLPDGEHPLRGTAEVMRTTDATVERIEGVGVRFTGFPEPERRRLVAFLSTTSAP